MADKGGSSLVPIALFGAAAYFSYKLFLSPATSAAQTSGTPAPPATSLGVNPQAAGPVVSTPGTATGPAPAQSPYNSLAQTWQRLNAQVQANATDPALTSQQGVFIATPSVFNYYLAQVSSFNLDAPGMAAAFPGGDVPMSLGAFWSAASQYLAQSKGLSGFRGMAGLILSRGRR